LPYSLWGTSACSPAGRATYHTVVDWQMRHLAIHAVWAAFVALAFPPPFGFA
jgi:hypothetical protein